MKMNWLEKWVVNNPARASMQRRVADRWWRAEAVSLKSKTVLEIGCGQGAGTELLLERYGASQVIAFDYDPKQLDLARRRLTPKFNDQPWLFVGDAERLPFRAGRFDVVVEFAILHHVPDWRRALREVARVLKPGGWFFYEEFLRGFVAHPISRALLDHPRSGWFTAEEFNDTLRDVGLTPTSQRQVRQWWLTGAARIPLGEGAAPVMR